MQREHRTSIVAVVQLPDANVGDAFVFVLVGEVVEVVIFDGDGEAVTAAVRWQPLGHRPRPKDARLLETQIEVRTRQVMLVENECGEAAHGTSVLRISTYAGPVPTAEDEYTHGESEFTDRITAEDDDRWPVEPGRYRLVASLACPWATRAVIVRRLLGLEEAISLAVVDPIQDERSWRFTLDPGGRDPGLGIRYLAEAYDAASSDYSNGVSVPAVVDVPSGRLVTNDFPQITLDLSTQWADHHRDGAPDLYPQPRRDEIDDVMARVYRDLNDAVYGAGFASSQRAYEQAYAKVFDCLDWMSERLRHQRYLVADTITEADVRAFTTLVRFDPVYHGHFKCNRNKIAEDPVLWAYLRDLYQTPGFGDVTNFAHIKTHYYRVHTDLNPSGIVPMGPDLEWGAAHGREALGGSHFGGGTPPPASTDLATYRVGT
ncbi:hypothetical protein BH18ACT8_BH18ACT8_16490 [soil metagenome]